MIRRTSDRSGRPRLGWPPLLATAVAVATFFGPATGAAVQSRPSGPVPPVAASPRPPDRFARVFTDEHGLPSGVVLALAQDSAGVLWIGTAGGLARYGGRDIEVVRSDVFGGGIADVSTSPAGRVAVIERGRRELWLTGSEEAFEVVRRVDGAPLRRVRRVQFDHGDTLWIVAEDGGLVRRTPGGAWLPPPALAADSVEVLFTEVFDQSDGGLLIATRDSSGSSSLWTWPAGGPGEHLATLDVYEISAATRATDGTVWLGTNDAGSGSVHRVKEGRVERVSRSDMWRLTGLASRGDHVYASDPRGLYLLSENGRREPIGGSAGVPGGGPLLLDREESLWLGTSSGLAQYPEPETATWGAAHGLASQHAEFVGVSPRGVWLSTWQGLGLLENVDSRWRANDVQNVYFAVSATRLCVDGGGAVWLNAVDPVSLVHSVSSIRAEMQHHHRLLGGRMACARTGSGSVLVLADDTVYRTTPAGELAYLGPMPPSEGSGTQRIAATGDGGIMVVREPNGCDASIDKLTAEGAGAWTCSRLPDVGEVRDLAVVPGPDGGPEPWLASFSGGVLHRVNGEWRQVEAMGEIPQRAANGLFPSPRGGIWAFGFGFVVRLAPVRGQWEIVEHLGGWQGVAGEVRSLWEEADGTLWLASWRGVTRVPASARSRPAITPRIHLAGLRVDGERAPTADAVLPSDHRVVEIEFSAGALRDPRRARYRMRLDGVEWIDAHEPVFRLAGIAPGEHQVEAAASLDGRLWGPASQLRFRVRSPWYASGWVPTLGAVLLLGVGLVAHRLRTRHLIDLERQRVRIAMDLHDELGAGLGSLGILGGVMADGSAPPQERRRLGEQVARTAAELGASLHDIVYSLRTGDAHLERLADQIKGRGQTLFAGNGVRFVGSPGPVPRGTVAPSVSRHVYRLAVEALHNAARHAHAERVGAGIESVGGNGQLRLWIEDDGCGIDPSKLAEPGGMGIVTMRRRAEAIGGELSIDSRPGAGTRIEVTFGTNGRRRRTLRWRRARTAPGRSTDDGPGA